LDATLLAGKRILEIDDETELDEGYHGIHVVSTLHEVVPGQIRFDGMGRVSNPQILVTVLGPPRPPDEAVEAKDGYAKVVQETEHVFSEFYYFFFVVAFPLDAMRGSCEVTTYGAEEGAYNVLDLSKDENEEEAGDDGVFAEEVCQCRRVGLEGIFVQVGRAVVGTAIL